MGNAKSRRGGKGYIVDGPDRAYATTSILGKSESTGSGGESPRYVRPDSGRSLYGVVVPKDFTSDDAKAQHSPQENEVYSSWHDELEDDLEKFPDLAEYLYDPSMQVDDDDDASWSDSSGDNCLVAADSELIQQLLTRPATDYSSSSTGRYIVSMEPGPERDKIRENKFNRYIGFEASRAVSSFEELDIRSQKSYGSISTPEFRRAMSLRTAENQTVEEVEDNDSLPTDTNSLLSVDNEDDADYGERMKLLSSESMEELETMTLQERVKMALSILVDQPASAEDDSENQGEGDVETQNREEVPVIKMGSNKDEALQGVANVPDVLDNHSIDASVEVASLSSEDETASDHHEVSVSSDSKTANLDSVATSKSASISEVDDEDETGSVIEATDIEDDKMMNDSASEFSENVRLAKEFELPKSKLSSRLSNPKPVKSKSLIYDKARGLAMKAGGCYLINDPAKSGHLIFQWSDSRLHNAFASFVAGANVRIPAFKLRTSAVEQNLAATTKGLMQKAVISFFRTAQKYSAIVMIHARMEELGLKVYALESTHTVAQVDSDLPLDLSESYVQAVTIAEAEAYKGLTVVSKGKFINLGNEAGEVLDLDNDVSVRLSVKRSKGRKVISFAKNKDI